MKAMCKTHRPSKLGYVEHSYWAERKMKMGHKQRQCPICKFWFFKCEMGKVEIREIKPKRRAKK